MNSTGLIGERPGLNYEDAANKLHYLLEQAHHRQISGVTLKDEGIEKTPIFAGRENFLLGN
jgi:ethanolamine ammonia-lyase small subunit